MAADVAGDFASSGGMTDVDRPLKVELLDQVGMSRSDCAKIRARVTAYRLDLLVRRLQSSDLSSNALDSYSGPPGGGTDARPERPFLLRADRRPGRLHSSRSKSRHAQVHIKLSHATAGSGARQRPRRPSRMRGRGSRNSPASYDSQRRWVRHNSRFATSSCASCRNTQGSTSSST